MSVTAYTDMLAWFSHAIWNPATLQERTADPFSRAPILCQNLLPPKDLELGATRPMRISPIFRYMIGSWNERRPALCIRALFAELPFCSIFLRKCYVILTFIVILLLAPYEHTSANPGTRTKTKADKPLIIRSIQIEVREVFDEPDLALFYRAANSVKVSTKENVVRRELLFKEGDVLDQFLLEESERNLRALSFLRKVEIIRHPDGEYVDLLVRVQDAWTILLQAGGNLGGGNNSQSVGITEGNLLGYGKRVELLAANDEGREKYQSVWDDPRVMGTYQRLLMGYFDRSDGYQAVGFYGRPYRSLTDKDSWKTFLEDSDTVGRLFELGSERYIFRQRHEQWGASYSAAFGDPESLRRRLSLGYEHVNDTFKNATLSDFQDIDLDPSTVSHDQSLLPEDREFNGPVFGYDQVTPDYISLNYLDRFERVQDLNLGLERSIRVQWAPEDFGSTQTTYLVNFNERRGVLFDPTSFLRGELGLSSRYENGAFKNSLIRAESKYYNIFPPSYISGLFIGKHTLASAFYLNYGKDFDLDRELTLGVENGLRGYENRTFAGDKLFLFTLEDRVHFVEDIFKLVSLGAAAFFDAGGTTRDDLGDLVQRRIYTDAGVGLRFGFPRSQGGGVLRVDLAFPLRDGPDGDTERFKPLLFVSTGQSFTSFLSAESSGLEYANVTVGLDR